MEAKAIAKSLRVSPIKARLVVDLIRGKDVNVAINTLNNRNKKSSLLVLKTLNSAVANAVNNFKMDQNKLYVKEIYANEGITMKRYLPKAKGSASTLLKRTSNIVVVVAERN
jgi:large subunit ribosomal protein L22